jgi:hypothetical protein
MKDNKQYKILDIVDEKSDELSNSSQDEILAAYNKFMNKLNEIREANQLRVARVFAHILCKTVLKNYLFEMMRYERYCAQDHEEKIK